MDPKNDFETLFFNPFELSDDLFCDNNDPDENFFKELQNSYLNTPYLYENEIEKYLSETTQMENLSILHLNIRSINANFEKFKLCLEACKFSFNVICLSETWSSDKDFQNNSLFHIQGYQAIHYKRHVSKRGGGLLIYIKSDLVFKIRHDVNISDSNREFLSIEIVLKETKNFIITCSYKPPTGSMCEFYEHIEKIFNKAQSENKGLFILGDFNLNCLNYAQNS